MELTSTNGGQNPMPDLLKIGASRQNYLLLFMLVVVTCCLYPLDLFLGGGVGPFTAVVAVFTIWQALRTFITLTVFRRTQVEHRSIFGGWQTAEYSRLLITTGTPESIILVGEDTAGKAIKIRILRIDGDLKTIATFVRFASDYNRNISGIDAFGV